MTITKHEFEKAYEAGREKTVRFLMSRGLSQPAAEDAAQAAWARGWEKRESLRKAGSIVGWINTIAFNIFRHRYRRNQRLEQAAPGHEIAVRGNQRTVSLDIERALDRCSAGDRALLLQLYVEGYSSQEIGRERNLKPSTVRVRVHRARQKLREFLGGSTAAPDLATAVQQLA